MRKKMPILRGVVVSFFCRIANLSCLEYLVGRCLSWTDQAWRFERDLLAYSQRASKRGRTKTSRWRGHSCVQGALLAFPGDVQKRILRISFERKRA